MNTLQVVQDGYDKLMNEKHQRLLDLGKYTPEELTATTKPVLYARFKEHISTELSKELYGKGKSQLTKAELLSIIEYILKDIREARKVAAPIKSYNPEDLQVSPTYVITSFKNGVKPEVCADNSIRILKSGLKKTNDGYKNEGMYQFNTLSVKVSNLLSCLRSEMPDSATSEVWLNKYSRLLNEAFADGRRELSVERQQTLESYGNEVLAMIDGQEVEAFVKDFTATYLNEDHNPNKDWHLASFVLALTSGRRMIEIHGNISTYEKVDDHHIRTVGLAKKLNNDGTKNTNFEHVSPIAILSVDEWFAIYNKLPDSRKNCDKKTVNGTISRAMSDNVSYCNALDVLGFVNLTKHKKKRGNYHNARDFYINYMIAKNPFHPVKRPMKDINYAISLVAHEGKAINLNYDKVAVYNV